MPLSPPPPSRRQELYEQEMEQYIVRPCPLGLDRKHRRYWWGVGGVRGCVSVEGEHEGEWHRIDCPEQLEQLAASLDTRVGG